MPLLTVAGAAMTGFAVSYVAVLFMMRRAARLGLIQCANERSSHTAPTPTGGGAGFVAGALIGGVFGLRSDFSLTAIFALGLAIALVGLADDRWTLPARFRLTIQFILLGTLIFQIDPLAAGSEAGSPIGPFVMIILIVAGVWWLNLFNFMDGIDGLAASQTICMLTGSLLFSLQHASLADPLIIAMIATGTAVTGFLLFNWPPAKIFMGDAGSLFSGMMLFAFALMTSKAGWMNLPQWIILGCLFLGDATATLSRRLIGGKAVMEAHRSHAYQILSRRLGGHLPVTSGAVVFNILVTFPCAWFAGQDQDIGWLLVAGLMALTMMIAWSCGAGTERVA